MISVSRSLQYEDLLSTSDEPGLGWAGLYQLLVGPAWGVRTARPSPRRPRRGLGFSIKKFLRGEEYLDNKEIQKIFTKFGEKLPYIQKFSFKKIIILFFINLKISILQVTKFFKRLLYYNIVGTTHR